MEWNEKRLCGCGVEMESKNFRGVDVEWNETEFEWMWSGNGIEFLQYLVL